MDQYEEVDCDFEWSGGVEPMDGASLVKLTQLTHNEVEATIEFFIVDAQGLRINYEGEIFLVKKIKSEWKINGTK